MNARAPMDCTILIVDDEEANLDLLEEFLSAEGWHSIVRTDDSRSALPLFEEHWPDLVLLDLHMPHMSGYEVLRQIQERVAQDDFVPVVILTADMLPSTRTRALADGAHDFLTKPLDVVEVRLRVRNLLRTRLSHLEQRRAREAAEAATRAREMILSVVAHDLRNPLASIAMDAEMARHLLSEKEHPEPSRSLVQIERTAGRMHNLIEDLLEVARLEHGSFAVRLAPTSPAEIFADADTMLQPIARSRSIELIFRGDADLPPVAADRQRLVQVLSNLVGNALKFTPAEGTVEVTWSWNERELIVSVMDTGPGIPPDQLVHVFDSFWRGVPERRGGLGLGLTIARAIIEAHDGRIWMESAEGQGTVVHFTIPFAAEALDRTDGVTVTPDGGEREQ
jgi:signal transduction histidine kinase